MTTDEQKQANKETIDRLKKLQEAVQEITEKQTSQLQSKATKTFRDLVYMTWITFLLGLVLVASSFVLFALFQQKTPEVLGLGSLGVADWLALFFYKPMDRLQKANADFAQQVIILKSWALSVNLELLAMDVHKAETVITASKNIRAGTAQSAREIQEFIEKPEKERNAGD